MSSLKKLAIRGTFWTIIGYGSSQVIRLASNLILTRLLFPEFFGLMAIVNVFIIGLNLFSDIGINLSIVQNKRGEDPDFYNTAWSIQVIRGFGLWIACCILAFPVASLYDTPQLRILLPVVGLSTIINGFNSTSLALLDRNLAVQKKVLFEIVTQMVGIAVMVGWALITPSIWSLVAGNFASSIVRCVWSHFLPNGRNKFVWDQSAVGEIFSIGKWVFISTALTFSAEQADKILLGKLFTLAMLGVYQVAITLSEIPRAIVLSLGGQVLFPLMSKIIDQPVHEIARKFFKSRRWLLLSVLLVLAALASCGDIIINFLYDDRYAAAEWMFPILTVGIWPRILAQTSEPFLYAKGIFVYGAAGNFSRLVCTVIGVTVGFRYLGELGAILAVALNDLFYYLVVTFGLVREKLNPVKQDILSTALLFLVIFVIVAGRISLGLGHPLDSLSQSFVSQSLL